MKIKVINKANLTDFESLILPYAYRELEEASEILDELDMQYICLAALPDSKEVQSPNGLSAVSAVICRMEEDGDLSIRSIYTLPEHRRNGYASELLDKVASVARQLFIWESEEDAADVITLKVLYRLRDEFRLPFEAFLKANHFTELIQLDTEDGIDVWAGMAHIFIYRAEGLDDVSSLTEEDRQIIEVIKTGDLDNIEATFNELGYLMDDEDDPDQTVEDAVNRLLSDGPESENADV